MLFQSWNDLTRTQWKMSSGLEKKIKNLIILDSGDKASTPSSAKGILKRQVGAASIREFSFLSSIYLSAGSSNLLPVIIPFTEIALERESLISWMGTKGHVVALVCFCCIKNNCGSLCDVIRSSCGQKRVTVIICMNANPHTFEFGCAGNVEKCICLKRGCSE